MVAIRRRDGIWKPRSAWYEGDANFVVAHPNSPLCRSSLLLDKLTDPAVVKPFMNDNYLTCAVGGSRRLRRPSRPALYDEKIPQWVWSTFCARSAERPALGADAERGKAFGRTIG